MSWSSNSIAIIGIGLRLPGGIRDTDSLWTALDGGKDFFRAQPPKERFNGDAFYHPARGHAASFRHQGGYYLDDDLAAFDAGFFGISAAEASAMDPQQRHLLEVTFECVENAGLQLENIRGSETGVFVATFMHDFENMMLKDPLSVPKYAMTGMGSAITSNRLSYFFDFRGPSVSIDTGCSGGLVAVHQACQSLLMGETELCFAGASNLLLSPDSMIALDLVHLLSTEGRCYPFDERGSGYGRGEGTIVFALKRLDDAIKARDDIRGVIRASALGQDGKTYGITMPSSKMQQVVVEKAYRSAGLDVMDTPYVEAHGTGTIAGDDAEVAALAASFKTRERAPKSLYIGSAKSNFGHLESASGLIGLLKCVLALEKRQIAPNAGTLIPKARLELSNRSIRNSFGYGGTISHLIIDGFDRSIAKKQDAPPSHNVETFETNQIGCEAETCNLAKQTRETEVLIVLSAANIETLGDRIHDLQEFIHASRSRESQVDLNSLGSTLARQRSHLHYRYAFTASSPDDILGQGSQYAGMGVELLESSKTFAQSILASEEILIDLGASWKLTEELSKSRDSTELYDSRLSQPCLTAIQIALVDNYASLSIVPNTVLGHSSGEIAAAYAAKVLTKRDALKIAYLRGINASNSREAYGTPGAMLAVSASENVIKPHLIDKKVRIACRNSRFNFTLSGDFDAIQALKSKFQTMGLDATILKTDVAYHSHHMVAISDSYLAGLDDIQPATLPSYPTTTFVSSVDSQPRSSNFYGDYWVKNLTSPVNFYPALENILDGFVHTAGEGSKIFTVVEIGPHKILKMPVSQTVQSKGLASESYTYLPSMLRDEHSNRTFLYAVGALFQQGFEINFGALYRPESMGESLILPRHLPLYRWNHKIEYWEEPRLSREHRFRAHSYHDLLGIRLLGTSALEPIWRHHVSTKTLPWLRDHEIGGRLIFPGAAYLAMAIEGKSQISRDLTKVGQSRSFILEDIHFTDLLEIPASDANVELQVSLRLPLNSGNISSDACHEFRIVSVLADGTSTSHCHGRISVRSWELDTKPSDIRGEYASDEIVTETGIDSGVVYQDVQAFGHRWGPSFALIKELAVGPKTASGIIKVGNTRDLVPGRHEHKHIIHPTVLDAILHSSFLECFHSMGPAVMMPVVIARLEISSKISLEPTSELKFRTAIEVPTPRKHSVRAIAWDSGSEMHPNYLVRVEGAILRSIPARRNSSVRNSVFDKTFGLILGPGIQSRLKTLPESKSRSLVIPEMQPGVIGHEDSDPDSIVSNFELEGCITAVEGVLSGLSRDICYLLGRMRVKKIFFISTLTEDPELIEMVKTRLWQEHGVLFDLLCIHETNMIASNNILSELLDCIDRCTWMTIGSNARSCLSKRSSEFLFAKTPAVHILISPSASSFQQLISSAQDAMDELFVATSEPRLKSSPFAMIHLSALKDLRSTHQDARSDILLAKAGLVGVDLNELSEIICYAAKFTKLSPDPLFLIAGLDVRSIASNGSDDVLKSDLFKDIQIQSDDSTVNSEARDPSRLSLKDARSLDEAEQVVTFLLRRKIAGFFSFDEETLDMNTPMEDFGLDSMARFSLSSWLKIELDTSILEAQVIECASAYALIAKILQESTALKALRNHSESERETGPSTRLQNVSGNETVNINVVTSPVEKGGSMQKQPLSTLQETQDAFLEGLQTWLREGQSRDIVKHFEDLSGAHQHLQSRLLARSKDANIANWLEDLYTPTRFLQPRSPTTPTQTYYGTHPDGSYRHTQARRAALICQSVYAYSQKMYAGELEDQSLYGQVLDPDSLRYFFNAARIAKIGRDKLDKFDRASHIVVLCKGQPFRMELGKLNNVPDQQQVKLMERTFNDILIHSERLQSANVGALTAGERDECAKVCDRWPFFPWDNLLNLIQLLPLLSGHQDGHRIIQLIQNALFVICLDSRSPSNAQQRFEQFLAVECGNRWFDKPLQFAICRNGESATIVEHAAIDGVAIGSLERSIGSTITSDKDNRSEPTDTASIEWESIQFPRLPELEAAANEIHLVRLASLDFFTFDSVTADCLSSSFFESLQFPIQSGIQLAIQLASLRFFGEETYSLETVSLAHFRHGRVETNPVIRPCMLDFLKSMDLDPRPDISKLKGLARSAALEYTKNNGRAGRGKGFGRHLLALEWVLQANETRPSLFDDPMYTFSKKARLLTSCFPSGWKEGGFVYPVPSGILVYFEVRPNCIPFSIYGNQVNASEFGAMLTNAAKDVAQILAI